MILQNPFVKQLQSFSSAYNISAQLDWKLEIKDADLRKDFHAYCLNERSSLILVIFTLFLTFIALPLEVVVYQDLLSKIPHLLYIIIYSLYIFFAITTAISGWGLILMPKIPKLSRYDDFISGMYILSFSLVVSLRILRYSILPCELSNVSEILMGRECISHLHQLPWDSGANLVVPSMVFVSLNKERRLWLILLSFIIPLVTISAIIWEYFPNNFSLIFIWVAMGILLLIELHLLNLSTYFLKRKLVETLVENENIREKNQAQEMRHMIANVAHDLKTPLSSFISGVDIIESVLKDCEGSYKHSSLTLETCYEKFLSIGQYLEDIRNTNSFMLMTINRCIDYTKASKGMKLVPRYETIDLLETLRLPLNCMRNIQNRVNIILNHIPEDICSHIITDKQWLQENILCLLSNAVKYSSEGDVTITVSLQSFVESSQDVMIKNDLKLKLTKPNPKPNKTSFRIFPVSHSNGSNLTDDKQNHGSSNHSSVQNSIRSVFDTVSFHRISSENNKPIIDIANSHRIRYQRESLSSPTNEPIVELHSSTDVVQEFNVIRFEVEDHGIGMTEEAMASLFNPFKQTQRLAGGTGLGLYSLAKRIESLNGHHGVKKRKDGGQGSSFWFTIPYKPDEITASMLTEKNEKPLTRSSIRLGNVRRTSSYVQIATTVENHACILQENLDDDTSNSKLTILLVDDSPTILKMTSLMLKKLGHRIITVENGAIAVERIENRWEEINKGFDLVLMDLQMPVMDGLEATRRIRSNEEKYKKLFDQNKQSNTRKRQMIVGCSANSDSDTTEEAFKAGVDAFMSKPFAVDSFQLTASKLVPKISQKLT